MSTLLLRLKAPQQSWGTDSRYRYRETGWMPSKSGVIGMLAAAQGRPREADITDLLRLKFAVRIDQPGRLLVDYHTARAQGAKNTQLSHRHYRADAAYYAAVSGPEPLISGLSEALDSPVFPLFLGRRSCPAPVYLNAGVYPDTEPETLLSDIDRVPWLASDWFRTESPTEVRLPVYRDARPGEVGESVQDVPVSFDPRHRHHSKRTVVQAESVVVQNGLGKAPRDPFFQTVLES